MVTNFKNDSSERKTLTYNSERIAKISEPGDKLTRTNDEILEMELMRLSSNELLWRNEKCGFHLHKNEAVAFTVAVMSAGGRKRLSAGTDATKVPTLTSTQKKLLRDQCSLIKSLNC